MTASDDIHPCSPIFPRPKDTKSHQVAVGWKCTRCEFESSDDEETRAHIWRREVVA